MSTISDLTKSLVDNMSAKNDQKIEAATQQVITEVKEVVVQEVIREELNVDLSGLATKDEVTEAVAGKADKSEIPDVSAFVTALDVKEIVDENAFDDTELKADIALKADSENVYTKEETDALLIDKADKTDIPDISDLVTKEELEESKYNDTAVIAAINEKANLADTYTKSKVDELLNQKASIDELPDTSNFVTSDDIALKADVSDVNNALALKADKTEIPDISNLATKDEVALKADIADIPDTSNFATKNEVEESKYDDTEIKADIALKADASNVYTKDEVVSLLEGKANLDEIYRKVDTYSADQIQQLLDLEANKDSVYTISQVDDMLATKADKTDIPDISNLATKTEVEESKYDDTEIKASVAEKANSIDVYTKEETNNLLADKAGKTEIPDVSAFITAEDIISKANVTDVSDALALKADKAEIPDISNLATKEEVEAIEIPDITPLATKEEVQIVDNKVNNLEIPSIEGLATIEYVDSKVYDDTTLQTEVANKADKADLFNNGVFNAGWTASDGSTHYFNAEAGDFGGIFSYNAPKDIKIFVGHNKSTGTDNIDGQFYAINNSSKIGTRLQISQEKGLFYLKNCTNQGLPVSRELATLEDIPDISNLATKDEVAGKANTGDVTELLLEKANKNDIPDVSGLATKTEVAEAIEAIEIPDISGKANTSDVDDALALKADKADIPDISNLATKEELDEIEIPDITPLAIKTDVDDALALKADKTEIPDISDLATKTEVEESKYDDTDVKADIALKANATDVYTKDEIDNLLIGKADLSNVYTKIETMSSETIQQLLDLEANKDSVYTISQVDDMLAVKANSADIPDVSSFITADDIANKADKSEIPDVSGFAVKTNVDDALALKADKTDIPDVSDFVDVSTVNAALELKADKTEIPDVSDFATKNEVEESKYDDTEVKASIALKADATALDAKADKADLFKNNVFNVKQEDQDGSYNLFFQEKNSGGGNQYFNAPTNTLSYLGVNKPATAGSDVDIQLYSKDKTSNIGTRINISSTKGMYYLKDSLNLGFPSDREVATIGDIPDVSEFLTAEDIADLATKTEVSDGLALKADAADIPDVSSFITADDIADKADKSEIPDVSGFAVKTNVDDALTLKADKTEIPDISNLATKQEVIDSQYDDTEIKASIALKADATALDAKVNTTDIFKNNVLNVKQEDSDGSYNLLFQEKNSGGGNQYFNAPTNTLSYLGVNKPATIGSDVDIQLYSKDKTSNIGTRINISSTKGMFYLKNSLNTGFTPGREVAVKDDIDALVSRIADLEALVATLQTALANAVDANGNPVYTIPSN